MKRMMFLTVSLALTFNLAAQNYRSERPSERNRRFTSEVIELKISNINFISNDE